MIVTVTHLRLRSVWGFFRLSWNGFKITLQARSHQGFVKMKNTGFGYDHYTISQWKSLEAAKAFAHSGAHLEAMKTWRTLATEIRIHSYAATELPSWADAKKRVLDQGRLFT